MVVTRPQAKAVFNHILDNVLGRDDTSGLKMSLLKVGVQDIFDLCTIEESTIDALCYDKSPTEADFPISRNDKTLLRILKSFVGHLRSSGSNPLSLGTDWTSMTQEEFDDFRVFQYRSYTPPPSQPSPAATSSSPMTTPPKHSPADLSFHRGIKCDPSLFPVLKEEKSNDTWHRSFADQACSQDVMQALDPAYVLLTAPEGKELCDKKQKVYYKQAEAENMFPSEHKESVVLTTDTQKAIYQSQVQPYDSKDRNLCAELFGGEDDPTTKYMLKYHSACDESGESKQPSTPVFSPQDFVRRTFLTDKQADGQQDRAKMVKLVDDITQDPVYIHDKGSGITWELKHIVSHQGPLKPGDRSDYKGSKYNIIIELENGESTSEPLSIPAIVLREPQESVDILMRKYKFKLNGTGHISYPPELDTSELLNDNKGIKDYRAAQWAVSIGRLDITYAVATMSGFRIAPRQGHLHQFKCTYGYLSKMHVTYVVSKCDSPSQHSLVDRGSNGGVAGNDVRVISKTDRKVDIQGIDNHCLNGIGVGNVGAYVDTQKGPIIAIFHEYALYGKGITIHSPGQFEYHKNVVCDKSVHVGGLQLIKTSDGYLIPLTIKNGLARLQMRPYTDKEWDTVPHVFFTSETEWEPSVLDHTLTDDESEYLDVPNIKYNSTRSVYGELSEVLPADTPSPLGNYVTLTHYANANVWDQRLALIFDSTGIIQDQGFDVPPSTKRGVTKSE